MKILLPSGAVVGEIFPAPFSSFKRRVWVPTRFTLQGEGLSRVIVTRSRPGSDAHSQPSARPLSGAHRPSSRIASGIGRISLVYILLFATAHHRLQ